MDTVSEMKRGESGPTRRGRPILLFEEPLPAGWVYPCTLDDVRERLQTLPPAGIEGLWAVGLAAATRKDCNANGRYRSGKRPTIRLYSFPDHYSYRQPPHTKPGQIEAGLAVEREYGMTVERVGSRFRCRWEPDALREFIIEHVLLHEVGHHVFARERGQRGISLLPGTRVSEQFAEDYALRHGRHSRPGT